MKIVLIILGILFLLFVLLTVLCACAISSKCSEAEEKYLQDDSKS